VTMVVTARRFARVSPATAWVLGGLATLLAAAVIPLSILARQDPLTTAGVQLASLVPFAAVGLVVTRHRPRDPMGWLMIAPAAGILFYAGVHQASGGAGGSR
jgi:hypothetical protein